MPRRNYSRSRKHRHTPITYVDMEPFIHKSEEVENEQSENSLKDFNFLDTGVVIAVLTAFGYFIAYEYQKGYWNYYGVTQEFLKQISLVNVLISISAFGVSLSFFFMNYQNMKFAVPDSNNPLKQVVKQIFLPLFFVTIGVFLLIPNSLFHLKLRHLLYIIFIVMSISYLLPILTQWGVKGYRNKVAKHLEKHQEEGITFQNIMLRLKYFPSAKYLFMLTLFIITGFVASAWGYRTAGDKEEYLLFKFQEQDYLVIDNNGENFIVAPINLKK
ncbi:hypothetical protein GFV16_26125, partial [Bacillus megaterium]|uniref:hypothetical protein n=1 Tax=Priestia megaterium TaxID=1404 RepID=UPI00129332B6